MSQNQTSKDIPNAISSPESAAGRKLSALPGGQQIALFGLDHVPANHLAAQESGKEKKTSGTCGRSSSGSSGNANRPSCSGNRSNPQKLSELSLRLLSLSRFKTAITQERINSLNDSLQANLSTTINGGSMEYEQTWKQKVTPSGLQYWAHTASTRRISGKGYAGWPTPQAIDASGQGRQGRFKKDGNRNPNSTGSYRMDLKDAALLTGWPTPNTNNIKGAYQDDAKNIARMEAGRQVNLQDVARLAGWATPTVQDSANTAGRSQFRRNSLPLNCEATLVPGQIQYGFPAPTEKRGVLNPHFSRWLMGYRAEWLCSEVLETLSSRK